MYSQRILAFCLLTIVLGFMLAGCKPDDFLADIDKNALFAPPTQTETEAILQEWKTRSLTPATYTVIEEKQIAKGKFVFKMVSFNVGDIKEYGALLIPASDSLLPVRLFIGGFGLGQTKNAVNLVLDTVNQPKPFILAIPALRGQSLEITINGAMYASPLSEGNHCDAFDQATDDVLTFLNGIQATENLADVNRVSVRGGSRGGTVALLAGIRDPRIKRVVSVAGPTDMLHLTSLNGNDKTYQCQFLSELTNGTKTITQTRNQLIASSPVYFAQYLPLSQLHMGLKDTNVPISQGYLLKDKLTQLGMVSKFEFYSYDRSHKDIATNNPELADRIEKFVSQL